MRTSPAVPVMMGLACLSVAAAGCGTKKEAFNVTISYVLQPTKPKPEGLSTVAVLDAGVKGDMNEDEARAQRWSKLAADMMESMIHDSAEKFESGLTVAKRRDTEKVLAEQDLKMAGLVEGGSAVQAAKLLDVQAIITSELNVIVEVKKSTKSTFDITSLYGGGGWHWGYGGGTVSAREAEAISRNMTLQCKFSMIDAGTGEALYEYAPKPFRKHDSKEPSPIYGRSSGEADLDSVDQYIGELVEEGTREFVSQFIPCEAEYSYELESSGNEASAMGVRLMRAEDYDGAVQNFKQALAEDPEDDRSAFCLGVTQELRGDWKEALAAYKRSCAMPGVDEEDMTKYLAAKDRVADQMDRVRRADAAKSVG